MDEKTGLNANTGGGTGCIDGWPGIDGIGTVIAPRGVKTGDGFGLI